MFSLVISYLPQRGIHDGTGATPRRVKFSLKDELEAVFVIDGSPDRSEAFFWSFCQGGFFWQLIALSRQFRVPFQLFVPALAETEILCGNGGRSSGPIDVNFAFREKLLQQAFDVVVAIAKSTGSFCYLAGYHMIFWAGYRALFCDQSQRRSRHLCLHAGVFRDHLITLCEKRSTLIG